MKIQTYIVEIQVLNHDYAEELPINSLDDLDEIIKEETEIIKFEKKEYSERQAVIS